MAHRRGAMVGLLVEAQAEWRDGRAAHRSLHAALLPTGPEHSRSARRVARREDISGGEYREQNVLSRTVAYAGDRANGIARERRTEVRAVDRQRGGILVGRRDCGPTPDRRIQSGVRL